MYVKLNFFLPLQELGRCFRGIWRYWRWATDINTLKEVVKFWSTMENSCNRQVDDVSLTVYVHTTHKHQPHASLSYLVTWLLLTSTTGLVKLHKFWREAADWGSPWCNMQSSGLGAMWGAGCPYKYYIWPCPWLPCNLLKLPLTATGHIRIP